MTNLPIYIPIVFIATTLLTLLFVFRSFHRSAVFLIALIAWLALQGFVASTGFYTVTNTLPPRFALLIVPALVFILLLFVTKPGKAFLDTANVKILTWLHIVRVPVELVLFWLFLYKQIPQVMTFEGRNFDIISGITAPLIVWVVNRWLSMQALMDANNRSRGFIAVIISWNVLCLALLFNILITAVLSAPSPFQQLAFDQPNVAIVYFPYVWLPCFIVPAVLLSHLIVIRKMLVRKQVIKR